MNFPNFLRIAMNATTYYYKVNGTLVSRIEFDSTFETITKVFAYALGFSYQLLHPKDGHIGTRLPNGNWTGVIGMLQRKEADLAITSLFMSLERAEVVDFSYPCEITKFSFATRRLEYHPKFTSFLDPFSLSVWLTMIALLLVMPLLLFLVFGSKYTLKFLFWSTFSSFIMQGIGLQPKKIVDYFILEFWLVGATVLIYSYTTVFLAFITFPSLTGVRTVSELAAAVTKGHYRCVTYHGSLIGLALSKSSDPNLKVIGRCLMESKGDNNMEVVLNDKTTFKKSAYVGIEAHLLAWKEQFFTSRDVILPMLTAVAIRKNFCCKSHLDRVIHRIWESGIFAKLNDERIYRQIVINLKIIPTSFSQTKERPITFEHLKGAFLLLGTGHFLSLLVFLFEVFEGKLYTTCSKHISCLI